MVWRTGRSRLCRKKGAIEQLYTAPPADSIVVCLDEMGPEAAKSFAGQALVAVTMRPAQRATQEIDYGRRGKGSVFGAFQPPTGAVCTWTAQRRTTTTVVAFLEHVETWIDSAVEHVYVILDN